MKAVESQLKDTTSVHKLTECLTCKGETLTAKTIQSRPVEAVGVGTRRCADLFERTVWQFQVEC